MYVLLAIYLAGVVIGLWRVGGRLPTKVALSVLWPIGPFAGILVVAGLLCVSLIAFPWVGLGVAAGATWRWWLTT